jgi:SAM-dependent methyltransferase
MLSLTPDRSCFYDRGISYQLSDARELPYRSGRFDVVTCISTLEHIGMDNRKYGGSRERAPRAYLDAVGEIRRVLRAGGTALFTVPYGAYAAHDLGGSQQRFDPRLLHALIARFHPSSRTVTFFRYGATGWIVSTRDACAGATYNSATFASLEAYRTRPVRAEAVACVAVRK